MYQLYLVNHTQLQYVNLCRSNFSQERVVFMYPPFWELVDDLEIMTEFVFREKLKNRKKYELVDAYPDLDSDIDPGSEKEDEQESLKVKYVKGATENDDKKKLVEDDLENKGDDDEEPEDAEGDNEDAEEGEDAEEPEEVAN